MVVCGGGVWWWCVYVRYCISYCIFLCLCEVVLVGIVCLKADVCVWEGGVFLCVYEMVCVCVCVCVYVCVYVCVR